jgi:PHD/YefM family antitoxin component YafN of YafNO toxin-antitoxin module
MTRKLEMNQAKTDFNLMIKDANGCLDKFIIIEDGKKKAIIMSFDEYESILDSMEMFSEDKAAVLK